MAEEWQASDTKFAGYGLDDEVRKKYFDRFENSLTLFEANIKYLSNGFYPKYLWEFVATVCALYVEFLPKFDYGKDADIVANMAKIESYIRTGVYALDQRTLEGLARITDGEEKKAVLIYFDFVKYFMQLRIFMEKNGITKYERPQHNPAEMILRGVAKS